MATNQIDSTVFFFLPSEEVLAIEGSLAQCIALEKNVIKLGKNSGSLQHVPLDIHPANSFCIQISENCSPLPLDCL